MLTEPGTIIDGIIEEIRFTNGSPFGEQWTTVRQNDGSQIRVATWFDFRKGEFPVVGKRLKGTIGKPLECETGFNSKIVCRPVLNCSYQLIKGD